MDGLFESIPEVKEEDRFTNDLDKITLHLNAIVEAWKSIDYPIAIDPKAEFSRGGIFCMFLTQENGEIVPQGIDLNLLTKEVVFNNTIGCIINELCNKASEAFLHQLDGANAQIKLQKNDKTYGFMFGLMEQMKRKYHISEYSCQQSTLEQVFNAFASEDIFSNFNRRLSKRRTSTLTGI